MSALLGEVPKFTRCASCLSVRHLQQPPPSQFLKQRPRRVDNPAHILRSRLPIRALKQKRHPRRQPDPVHDPPHRTSARPRQARGGEPLTRPNPKIRVRRRLIRVRRRLIRVGRRLIRVRRRPIDLRSCLTPPFRFVLTISWSTSVEFIPARARGELGGLARPEASRGRGGSLWRQPDARHAGDSRERFVGRARQLGLDLRQRPSFGLTALDRHELQQVPSAVCGTRPRRLSGGSTRPTVAYQRTRRSFGTSRTRPFARAGPDGGSAESVAARVSAASSASSAIVQGSCMRPL